MWELDHKGKAECWRTDGFELWCWRRLFRVPWATWSNQSILKEISPEYPLEGLMLKLKLWHTGHLMHRTDSLEKTLMLGKIDGRRRREGQRMRWLDGITDSMDMSFFFFLISHSVFIWYSMHLPFQTEKTQSEVYHFNKSPTSSFTSWIFTPWN